MDPRIPTVRGRALAGAETPDGARRMVEDAKAHLERQLRAAEHKQTFSNRAQERLAARRKIRADARSRRLAQDARRA